MAIALSRAALHRISLSRLTTAEEIVEAADIIVRTASKLKRTVPWSLLNFYFMKMTKKVKYSIETLVLERSGLHPASSVSDLDREEKVWLQGNLP